MDDLLAKPVALATLRQALLRWLDADVAAHDPRHAADAAVATPAAGAPSRSAIVQRFGSEHVANVMIDSMRSATEDDLRHSRSALDADDSHAAAEALHRMAGGLGALGAGTLAVQARTLMEQVEREGVPACRDAIEGFEQALRAYLASLQAG